MRKDYLDHVKKQEVIPSVISDEDIQLFNSSGTTSVLSNKADEEYGNMLTYLQRMWELDTEEEVYEKMNTKGMRLWSPFPGESAQMYKYFAYFIQLPVEHRSKSNVARYIAGYTSGTSLEEIIDGAPANIESTLVKINENSLFWYARAQAFEEAITHELVMAIEDTQRDRLAIVQQRAATIAMLSNDLALQMLVAASAKLASIDPEELRISDISGFAKVAGMLTRDGLAVLENSMGLSDILEYIEEFERVNQAEVIDG